MVCIVPVVGLTIFISAALGPALDQGFDLASLRYLELFDWITLVVGVFLGLIPAIKFTKIKYDTY